MGTPIGRDTTTSVSYTSPESQIPFSPYLVTTVVSEREQEDPANPLVALPCSAALQRLRLRSPRSPCWFVCRRPLLVARREHARRPAASLLAALSYSARHRTVLLAGSSTLLHSARRRSSGALVVVRGSPSNASASDRPSSAPVAAPVCCSDCCGTALLRLLLLRLTHAKLLPPHAKPRSFFAPFTMPHWASHAVEAQR
ncbi:hypothetical protein Taro_015965 [Colocasia esculenta]|uniref:Uncharacterized protein n=1 Tax=Colocasia esculenta TaxID=4460 RepID=A0A843UJB3_COLES|nr:hypothetical protein [Colocasia esculenta]